MKYGIALLGVLLAVFLAYGLWEKLRRQAVVEPDETALLIAEQYIDAFYSFEPQRLAPFLVGVEGSVYQSYYQAWAQAGHYEILHRPACYQARNLKVYCAIKVRDDIGSALGYEATDTFIFSITNGRIQEISSEADDPMVLTWIILSLMISGEHDFHKSCAAMFDGGQTPGACVRSVVAAARDWQI